MEFSMNGNTWLIKQVDQRTFWEDDDELDKMNNRECYFGRTKYDKKEIWLWNKISREQKIKTLYHELLHCYRGSYITFNELNNTSEDIWCDITANSHDIIDSIANEYDKQVLSNE